MRIITPNILEHLSLFQGTSTNTKRALTEKGHLASYPTGKYIFRDYDPVHYIYIVLSGRVTLYKNSENGQSKTVFILGPGDLLNETLFDSTNFCINAKTIEPCEILCYHKNDFNQFVQADVALMQNVINMLSKRVRRLYRQLKNTTSTTRIEKKLAAKIWKLGKDYGTPHPQGILINCPITVTALAELLGSYRETVSRALKLLIAQDLVIYKSKQLIIVDADALATFFKSP